MRKQLFNNSNTGAAEKIIQLYFLNLKLWAIITRALCTHEDVIHLHGSMVKSRQTPETERKSFFTAPKLRMRAH